MSANYIIRLDDACPTMNRARWARIEDLLNKYDVKPLVGVIPHNEDPEQRIQDEDPLFWDMVRSWYLKGWDIALHGFNHCYISNRGLDGMNPVWERSEFAGVDLSTQCEKVREGLRIFCDQGINPICFFSPSHTFDKNTIIALEKESSIRVISDSIALFPYKEGCFYFIPQQFGHCVELPVGVWTFCFHPNMMENIDFEKLEIFIRNNRKKIICVHDLDFSRIKRKRIIDVLFRKLYFAYRRLKLNTSQL